MSTKIGSTLLVTVWRKAPYGVFVKLEDGETGLIHVSQLRGNTRWLRDNRLSALQVGDELYAEIMEVRKGKKTGNRGPSLSERATHERLILERMPKGEPMSGYVTAKAEFGVFVYLKSWHVTGLLHVSRMEGDTREERDEYLRSLLVDHALSVMVTKIEQLPDRINFQLSQVDADSTGDEQ